ncbi:hypothetical protein vseg_001008 [Gypsophila vaccaria]
MKGTYVPKSQLRSTVASENSRRSTRRLRVDCNADNGSQNDESDTNLSYVPSDDDHIENDEDVSDLKLEDNILISSLDFVDDGYVPVKDGEWVADDEGYASRIYNNGEIYDGSEFGAIKLRPWMLFMDKNHFRDVLIDNYIQEGFYVVVVKANNSIYTTECAYLNCEWRIHVTVLPDDTSWAIKLIRQPEHGYNGVKTHSPMVTTDWVAKKLMEDITANLDIPATTIQNILMDIYGLQMKSSTLYKMMNPIGYWQDIVKWLRQLTRAVMLYVLGQPCKLN